MSTQPTEVLMRRAYGTGSLYERSGSWYARWTTVSGKRVHRRVGLARTAGKRDGLSGKEAEAKLREMMASDLALASRTGVDPLVSEMSERHLSRLRTLGRSPGTLQAVESHLRVHIVPLVGEIKVSQIDEQDAQKLMDKLMAAGAAPKQVRNVIGTFHSLMDLARRQKFIAVNPITGIDLPRAQGDPRIRFLRPAEVAAVLAATPAEDSELEQAWWPNLRLVVLMGAMTGMRVGEMLALRWEDLDWGANKVLVCWNWTRGEMRAPKSRRSIRAIPLAKVLADALDEHHRSTVWNQDHDLVLAHPWTGRPMDRSKLLKLFKRAVDRAGVRPVRLHDLRHTFATTMAARPNVSLRMLQEWLGHKDLKTTMIYADYMPADGESEMVDAAFAVDFPWTVPSNSAPNQRVGTP